MEFPLDLPSGAPVASPLPGSLQLPTGRPTATPLPPTAPRVDPREQLAEALAPVPGRPLLRKGKVTSIDTSASTWAAYVVTEGFTETPRRMGWNGNGSKPVVGDAVLYHPGSPMPFIIGRIATANQDQDFGTGQVAAGSFVDGSGNIRTDLSGTQTSLSSTQATVASLNSTVSTHTSQISGLQSTVSSHTSSISSITATNNSQQTSINTLNSTVSAHTTQIANLGTTNNNQQASINSLLNRVANLESLLTFYASNMTYLANLGANYKNHTAHPPPGGP